MKSILDYPVLVVNTNWSPINITTVRESIGMIYKGSADIIAHREFSDKFSDNESIVVFKYDILDYELWIGLSEIIDSAQTEFIRSGRYKHFRPRVVRLNNFKKSPNYFIKLSRRAIYDRDAGICQYCGIEVDRKSFTIDHVYPRSRGGKTVWSNIVVCCKDCNNSKDDMTPEEANMRLIKDPVKPGIGNFSTIYRDEFKFWKDFMKEKA